MSSSLASSANASANGTSSGGRRVTPAFMRSLMPGWPDPAEELYRKHQLQLVRLMELQARNQRFEASYSVTDSHVSDERLLQHVHERLLRWLKRKKFELKPCSKGPRSFTVTWDPVATADSVTPHELQNPHSVAVTRIRSFRRSTPASDPNLFDVLNLLSRNKAPANVALQLAADAVQPLARIDSNAYGAQPAFVAAAAARQPAQHHQPYNHQPMHGDHHDDDDDASSETMRKARAMAARAAHIAGADVQRQQQSQRRQSAADDTITASSDDS